MLLRQFLAWQESHPPTNVVNLMDALRRSVEAEKPTAARGKAAERKKLAKEAERRPARGRGRRVNLPDPFCGMSPSGRRGANRERQANGGQV